MRKTLREAISMHYILNGKELSCCAVGTWAWGTGANGSKIVFGNKPDETRLSETFSTATDLGFCLWDTAEVYGAGTSEALLGKLIAERSANVILSTKHLPASRYKKGECRRALEGSLKRLRRDSIDIYWLHSPKNIEQNMAELASLQNEGLVRSIGLSNGSVYDIRLADIVLRENGASLAAIQNHFSLLSIERESKVLTYCKKHDITFFGYMILEQGALTGKYNENHPFPAFSVRSMSFSRSKFRKIAPLIAEMKKLGEHYGVDTSQIAIAWAVAKGVVPIIGLTKPEQAVSLAQGMNVNLSSEEADKLERLALDCGVTCKGFWE